MKTMDKKSSREKGMDSQSQSCEKHSQECQPCQMYHQMSLSVSRFDNGEQTDIRIHRETGKPTEVYVSRGSEAWDVNSSELNQLPEDLRHEVKSLLCPSHLEKDHSSRSWKEWFFGTDEESDEEQQGLFGCCERDERQLTGRYDAETESERHGDSTHNYTGTAGRFHSADSATDREAGRRDTEAYRDSDTEFGAR
ncbi:MAG: hypothetical protein Q4D62_01265 [Planctomycetia bacterium]|nr:hypothetical protein [Planctomycetia bacterium]